MKNNLKILFFLVNLVLTGIILNISYLGIGLSILFLLSLIFCIKWIKSISAKEAQESYKLNHKYLFMILLLSSLLVLYAIMTETENVMKYFYISYFTIINAMVFINY